MTTVSGVSRGFRKIEARGRNVLTLVRERSEGRHAWSRWLYDELNENA